MTADEAQRTTLEKVRVLQRKLSDGKHVAVGVKRAGSRENIWIYDVQHGTRVPVDASIAGPAPYAPKWSPDGNS